MDGRPASWSAIRRALRSPAVAVVASTQLMTANLGLDAAFIGLLVEGHSLGAAVARLNLMRRGETRPGGLGPLVFGNPMLRFPGLRPFPVETRREGGEIVLGLPRPSDGEIDGLIAAFDVAPGETHARVTSGPQWLYGAIPIPGRAFLWTRRGESEAWDARLELLKEEPRRAALGTLRACGDGFAAWLPMLEIFRQRAGGDAVLESPAAAATQVAPSAVDGLARSFVGMSAATNAFCSPGAAERRLQSLERLTDDVAALLRLTAEQAVRTWGLAAVLELDGRETADDSAATGSLCACGRGRLLARHFRFCGGARLRRELQCEACGGLDVDDGRGLLERVSDRRSCGQAKHAASRLSVRPRQPSIFMCAAQAFSCLGREHPWRRIATPIASSGLPPAGGKR